MATTMHGQSTEGGYEENIPHNARLYGLDIAV
jgi:hypothetical protein